MNKDLRSSILSMLYRGTQTRQEFNWDRMVTAPILSLISAGEIDYLKKIIISPRYSGNNKKKIKIIDEVMHNRGFVKFAGGTNRLVYTHQLAPNAVFKVALDIVGINDNPAEYYNQNFLKPYCCKVFECSPCGTIASFEKVDRITTFEEFYTIADDYFYLLDKIIIGKYVMDDIGIDYFMNIGIRQGFGIVLLDFPYLFELDGRKLNCGNVLDDGSVCGGEVNYDSGFNKLICEKCGKRYRSRDLAKPPEARSILLRENGGRQMKLEICRGDKVIKSYSTIPKRDYIPYGEIGLPKSMKVELVRVSSKNKKNNDESVGKENSAVPNTSAELIRDSDSIPTSITSTSNNVEENENKPTATVIDNVIENHDNGSISEVKPSNEDKESTIDNEQEKESSENSIQETADNVDNSNYRRSNWEFVKNISNINTSDKDMVFFVAVNDEVDIMYYSTIYLNTGCNDPTIVNPNLFVAYIVSDGKIIKLDFNDQDNATDDAEGDDNFEEAEIVYVPPIAKNTIKQNNGDHNAISDEEDDKWKYDKWKDILGSKFTVINTNNRENREDNYSDREMGINISR